MNGVGDKRDMRLNPNCAIDFCVIKNYEFQPLSDKHKEVSVENCCDGRLSIIESPTLRGKKNRIKVQRVMKQNATTYRKCMIEIL